MLTVLVTGCGKHQITQIPDVTKPATLTLSPAPGQSANVHSFWLHIRGKIDGTAEIWGADLQTNRFSGNFKMSRDGDFYSSNCIVEYRPIGVRTGRISIEYEFRCAN
jgi:hypothetical protein